MNTSILLFLLGVILGGFFSWLFTFIYYNKSKNDFEEIIKKLTGNNINDNDKNEHREKKPVISMIIQYIEKKAPKFWNLFSLQISKNISQFQISINLFEFRNIIDDLKLLQEEEYFNFKVNHLSTSGAHVTFSKVNINFFSNI